MIKRDNKPLISYINIIPFVDIVLVLLIVFMVTSPMLNNGYNVNLPKSQVKQLAEVKTKNIVFTISENGTIREGDNLVSFDDLNKFLKKYDGKNTQIFLKADKHVEYNRVITFMNFLNSKGFSNISLVADALS